MGLWGDPPIEVESFTRGPADVYIRDKHSDHSWHWIGVAKDGFVQVKHSALQATKKLRRLSDLIKAQVEGENMLEWNWPEKEPYWGEGTYVFKNGDWVRP